MLDDGWAPGGWKSHGGCLSTIAFLKREHFWKQHSTQSEIYLHQKLPPPHTCSSNQVDQDTTIGYTATERNKGFHLFIVKEEVAWSLSQEHDLVDTRRNTEVKLCKNWPENFIFKFVSGQWDGNYWPGLRGPGAGAAAADAKECL